jgi:F0F1-type ATP synthase assembly protein I
MNFFVPPPISNLLIVVQAVLLALACFVVGKTGATYVGLIRGALSALVASCVWSLHVHLHFPLRRARGVFFYFLKIRP